MVISSLKLSISRNLIRFNLILLKFTEKKDG